ncbi:MAG: hypothetical protein ACFB51_01185 [Anaerolineae bacterium]
MIVTGLLWVRQAGSLPLRLHVGLVTLAALLLMWQANLWNLIGYNY